MTTAPKNWRDKVWLVWFVLQVFIILFIDGVPYFYPTWLYQPKGSPLHFLQQLRDHDISTYNDPLIQDHMAPNFMPFLFSIELGFQLPVTLYSAYRLNKGTTTGAHELLLLVYAVETAFSTMLCMNHALYLDPSDFTPEQKDAFLYQLMGPWVAFRE
ncbi:hypothetical protein M406DRAFT_69477 [Cryphonectria parasitica EP155]|uniref:Efficient mitochondria targeting-associated protein 19 n=1 Tax=Cryphonectria parasitica (strain ATCC 38755 / EP155) TaxID=660469 RepID=A0A9P4Y6M1_CRYP1|nr:uncharacterized protein M406DRAFT_69477 [Cryphonectria parasitica EP155]KAF3767322.1 hypothetical protein M406DRAFT_69477 [Cryphonectria parasitica EP155]